jgi:hypothetical protein
MYDTGQLSLSAGMRNAANSSQRFNVQYPSENDIIASVALILPSIAVSLV